MKPLSSATILCESYVDGHVDAIGSVAVAPDGRIITLRRHQCKTVAWWRVCAPSRCTRALSLPRCCRAGALLQRLVGRDRKLWTIDGRRRGFELGTAHEEGMCIVHCLAVLPDSVHFVVGLDGDGVTGFDVRLYHVDGTLIHTFEGHEAWLALSR